MHAYVVSVTNPSLPPVLFLPTGAPVPGESGTSAEASIELRNTPDGSIALVAFSSLEQLVECCGEKQHWVRVSTEHLPKLHAHKPYDLIMLDSPLPEGLRH